MNCRGSMMRYCQYWPSGFTATPRNEPFSITFREARRAIVRGEIDVTPGFIIERLVRIEPANYTVGVGSAAQVPNCFFARPAPCAAHLHVPHPLSVSGDSCQAIISDQVEGI